MKVELSRRQLRTIQWWYRNCHEEDPDCFDQSAIETIEKALYDEKYWEDHPDECYSESDVKYAKKEINNDK